VSDAPLGIIRDRLYWMWRGVGDVLCCVVNDIYSCGPIELADEQQMQFNVK